MLTSGDIELMRDAVESSLPGTAVISSRTFVSDGGGGGTSTWLPSGTVACRLSPMQRLRSFGQEVMVADRISEEATMLVTMPANTTINVKNRVTISAQLYEVLAVHEPRSWELSRRAECLEVS